MNTRIDCVWSCAIIGGIVQNSEWTRRAALAGGMAAGLLPAANASAQNAAVAVDELFPKKETPKEGASIPVWPSGTSKQLARVRWEKDDTAQPDLWWLARPSSMSTAFSFGFDDLMLLLQRAHFAWMIDDLEIRRISNAKRKPQRLPGKKFVFALRGCSVVSGPRRVASGDKLRLQAKAPDHKQYCCLIGVADHGAKSLIVFDGTTVANRPSLYDQANPAAELSIANYLPTGRYRYWVGTHGEYGDPPHWTFPLALRLDKADGGEASHVLLRPKGALGQGAISVNRGARWNFHAPADNIHPADTPKRKNEIFSSEGCFGIRSELVTEWRNPAPENGGYLASKGQWTDFSKELGLTGEFVKRGIVGVVFTGAEARAATTKDARGNLLLATTLRSGSSGDPVKKLQQLLLFYGREGGWDQLDAEDGAASQLRSFVDAPRLDGDFGPQTTIAWLMLQKTLAGQLPTKGFEFRAPSHVVTRTMLAALDKLAGKGGPLQIAREKAGLKFADVLKA